MYVTVAEQGWLEASRGEGETTLVLDFAVKQGLPPNHQGSEHNCSQDVQRTVCKSEHSYCVAPYPGYTARMVNYDGNAYIAGGCQS